VLEQLEQRAQALTADDRRPPLLAREGMTLELS
jgi:hypothetical protein